MTGFVIYRRPSDAEIKETVEQLKRWFVNNPKRRICRTQSFYGNIVRIRRNHVEEDLTKDMIDNFKPHFGKF